MTLGELIEYVRDHVLRDEAVPPLWPDDLLTRYFNEAVDQFAQRTHCLQDEESEFTTIHTIAGQGSYALDSRIVFVAEVFHAETGTPLRDRTRTRVGLRGVEGRPGVFRLDAAHSSLRLYPTPDDEYVIQMLVARKPLAPLVGDNDVPEVPEQYHLALCDWVAYRCLRANDPEQANFTASAGEFKPAWEEAVRDAKRDVYRLRTGPNPRAVGNWTGKR